MSMNYQEEWDSRSSSLWGHLPSPETCLSPSVSSWCQMSSYFFHLFSPDFPLMVLPLDYSRVALRLCAAVSWLLTVPLRSSTIEETSHPRGGSKGESNSLALCLLSELLENDGLLIKLSRTWNTCYQVWRDWSVDGRESLWGNAERYIMVIL